MIEIKLHLQPRSRAKNFIVLVQVIGKQCWPQVSLQHWNVAHSRCAADNLLLHLGKIATAQSKHLQMFILEISPCGVGEEKKVFLCRQKVSRVTMHHIMLWKLLWFLQHKQYFVTPAPEVASGEKQIKLILIWNVLPQTRTFLQSAIRLDDKFNFTSEIVKLVKFISEFSDFLHTFERK